MCIVRVTMSTNGSNPIERFTGCYNFLSNFYRHPFLHDGVIWPTAEHAYQAMKTLDYEERVGVCVVPSPGKAKRAGRLVTLREDWEQVKLEVMYEVLVSKFEYSTHTSLGNRLLETGEREIVEGNTWGDTYWGVCGGEGENHLGKLLMKVRAEIRVYAGAEA